MRKPESGTKSAVITSSALAISSALNFAALFIWVRVLTPSEFGVFALATGTALLINAAFYEWLRVVASRTLYSRGSVFKVDMTRANAILFFVLCTTVLLVFVSALFFELSFWPFGFSSAWIPLVIGLAISEMLLALLNVTSRLRMLPWQFLLTMVLRSLVSIALGLLLVIVFDWGVAGVLAATVVAQTGVAGIIIYRDKMWHELRLGFADSDGVVARREVLQLGLPLIAANALSYGAGIADRYLVKASLGAASVGYYSAPSDMVAKTLGMVMLAINTVGYPALVRAYDDEGAEKAREVLENCLLAQLALGAPIAVAFCVAPSDVARIMLGGPYQEHATVLFPFLAGAILLRFLISNHLMMIFQIKRKMHLLLISPVVTATVAVPLGLLWMKSLGLIGMAYAFLVAQALSWITCAVVAKKIFSFNLFTLDVAKVGLAAFAMSAAIRYARLGTGATSILLTFIFASLTYVVVLFALRPKALEPISEVARAKVFRLGCKKD